MMKPAFITFTGLDARTQISRIRQIDDMYPGRTEWGILFSENRDTGDLRYDSPIDFARFYGNGLRLSLHICGKAARNLAIGQIPNDTVTFLNRFSRIQVNLLDYADFASCANSVSNYAKILNAEAAILQCRGRFSGLSTACHWLYDCSGGKGRLPSVWPQLDHLLTCGYAGGIGPETIDSALAQIDAVNPIKDIPFWLDMESRVRTDGWLDLDKCEAVLRAVYEVEDVKGCGD